jgi:hypothetical protein
MISTWWRNLAKLAKGKDKPARIPRPSRMRPRSTYLPVLETLEDRIALSTLTVTSFVPTPTGFTATFNEPLNPDTIQLYTDSGLPDDVTVVTAGTQVSVRGSLTFAGGNTSITFKKTATVTGLGAFDPGAGLLAPGTYTLTLRSFTPAGTVTAGTIAGGTGFEDVLGDALAGSATGSPGSDFITTFTVSAPPVAVGVPDFARGPSNTDAIRLSGLIEGESFALTYTNPSATPSTGTATITFSSNAAVLGSNIQNALTYTSNANGGLANQIGMNNGVPNVVTVVTSDSTSGANVLVTFQGTLAQATGQMLTSDTPGFSVAAATIDLPSSFAGNGIPIALSNGQGVMSGSFMLQYDPSLLSLTGVTPSATTSSIPGATLTLSNTFINAHSAVATISLSSPTPISSSSSAVTLGSLTASVPMKALANYGASQLLHFSSVQLSSMAGPIVATGVDGIHLVAFFGDLTGQGTFNLNDAMLVSAAANAVPSTIAQTIPGFSSYCNLDPRIIGDVASQGAVNSTDASAIIQELAGTARASIPWAPIGLPIMAVGSATPQLSAAPSNQRVYAGNSSNLTLGSFTDSGEYDGPWTITTRWGDTPATSTFSVTRPGVLNQAHAYANPGTYTLNVTVTNALGLTASASGTVTVVSPIAPSDYTASYIITPYDTIPNFGAHPTISSVQSGPWSSPSTWSTGVVPNTGDIVSIEPYTTVTFDAANSAVVNTVIIQNAGQLIFRTDISTTLNVVNLLVLQGGLLQVGTQANPVAVGVTAAIVFANQPLNTTLDPSQYGNGLIALGNVTMCGAAKSDTFVNLAVEPKAGDTTLTLSTAVSGWKAGDSLFLPDTRQLPYTEEPLGSWLPQWEAPTIASVSADGTVLTLTAPLIYNHLGARDANGVLDFLPDVADLTNNVKVRSQSATGVRGQAMFTYRANVDIRHVTFAGLGRTTNDAPDNTTYDANGNVVHLGTNQQDRFAVNFHHLIGPAAPPSDGYQYTFIGNTVTCPLNPMPFQWGIAIDGSHYGLIQDNIVDNWAGAGIATEDGSESYNRIDHNFVVRINGTRDRPDARPGDAFDFTGDGIWLRGPNNYVTNNVISDVSNYGFHIYQVNVYIQNIPAFAGADPSQPGQSVPINMNATALLQFSGNTVYGATLAGLTAWYLGTIAYNYSSTVGDSIVKNFHVWNICNDVYYGYDTNRLVFDGLVARGDISQLGSWSWPTAVSTNDYLQRNFVIENSDIQGFQLGFRPSTYSGGGTQTVKNTTMINYFNVEMDTMWSSGNTGSVLTPRTTILDNVHFGNLNMSSLPWGPELNIFMNYPYRMVGNLIQTDQVLVYNYNGIAGDNFQVYYTQQAADYVIPQSTYDSNGTVMLVAAPVADLTNAEAWLLYSIAIGGAVAPLTATTQPLIFGLVAPI